ncbi:hypothetical protein NEOKW01_0920 [Nematocida sp. AWRm80]|nr:hypothetical protein NEOKW01_0920 [Nematocida sp. AWRm80]
MSHKNIYIPGDLINKILKFLSTCYYFYGMSITNTPSALSTITDKISHLPSIVPYNTIILSALLLVVGISLIYYTIVKAKEPKKLVSNVNASIEMTPLNNLNNEANNSANTNANLNSGGLEDIDLREESPNTENDQKAIALHNKHRKQIIIGSILIVGGLVTLGIAIALMASSVGYTNIEVAQDIPKAAESIIHNIPIDKEIVPVGLDQAPKGVQEMVEHTINTRSLPVTSFQPINLSDYFDKTNIYHNAIVYANKIQSTVFTVAGDQNWTIPILPGMLKHLSKMANNPLLTALLVKHPLY